MDIPAPEYHYGIWFMAKPDHSDFMAKLVRVEGKWKLEYRFRYYNPESKDPFDGKDKKNFYAAIAPDDSQESLDKMLACIKEILEYGQREFGFEQPDFVKMECSNDDPKFMFELGSRPWAHMKVTPKPK